MSLIVWVKGVVVACSSHGSNRELRGKQKHMKLPKESVHFHFCSRPLARVSHMASPRVKRQRNMLHHGEAMAGHGCQQM